jgi:hypothetical protein
MLGHVAIARRTLMSAESRDDYDRMLRSSSEGSAAIQGSVASASMAEASCGSPTQNLVTAATPLSTKVGEKAADWRYHAMSAAGLLLVVGLVYWINRHPGGRRAADTQSDPAHRSAAPVAPAATESGTMPISPELSSSEMNARKPLAPAPPGLSVARKSPIVEKRERGSGLAVGLGDKFSDVLSDIADQPHETPSPAGVGEQKRRPFQPFGGLSIGAVKQIVKPKAWPQELALVTEFPAQLQTRFQCERGFDWFDVGDNQLRVKIVGGDNVFKLTEKHFTMTPTSAIAFRTSLSAGMRGEVQVGFEIDGIRIGLRPFKGGIEVIARDRGKDASIDSVSKIKTGSTTSVLTVARDTTQPDELAWFVRTDDQDRTGTIGVTSLGPSPTTALFVLAPKKELERRLWIADLKQQSSDN